jgi:hypothetical protein
MNVVPIRILTSGAILIWTLDFGFASLVLKIHALDAVQRIVARWQEDKGL